MRGATEQDELDEAQRRGAAACSRIASIIMPRALGDGKPADAGAERRKRDRRELRSSASASATRVARSIRPASVLRSWPITAA